MTQLEQSLSPLLASLREVIASARKQALRAVDSVQVQTYWEIRRHIVAFEQAGELRAVYGKKLLANLAERLIAEFGKGFDERNLRNMRSFFFAFPIWNAVRTELSWTHYRLLSGLEKDDAKLHTELERELEWLESQARQLETTQDNEAAE